MSVLRHHALGEAVPASRHAVCCSLPTLDAVIGYEEKRPDVMSRLQAGYPRFLRHNLINQLAATLAVREGWSGLAVHPVLSHAHAEALIHYCGSTDARLAEQDGYYAVGLPDDETSILRARAFLQHTGGLVSTRLAEDRLDAAGLVDNRQPEVIWAGETDPASQVKQELGCIGCMDTRDIRLYASGMGAFYAAYSAISRTRAREGRDLWIQWGWLYVDTMRILERLAPQGSQSITLLAVHDFKELEAVLGKYGSRVAGLVTEVPTNPLLQTTDLPRLAALTRRHGITLVVDPTLASPRNVTVFPWADVMVNSLTKYAGNQGDVLAGALMLNPESPWYNELSEALIHAPETAYVRDLARLAHTMQDYARVVEVSNRNTLALVEYLQSHPAIARVHWTGSPASKPFYDVVSDSTTRPGAVFTIELNKPLAEFYDRMRGVKGPSFGVVFTLLCPFMYLAHYDQVTQAEGRRHLLAHGLNPELVRVSMGTEPAAAIMDAFAEALGAV